MILRLLAAFIFFTRLPFWKIAEVPAEHFKRVVSGWAFVGWLTAGLMVAVLYAASLVVPAGVALALAMATRLLATGCLHEDGLADFFDGFGGGATRERVLSIMKDSRIGSYGVIGLVFYFGIFFLSLGSLPTELAGCAILAGDPYCKGVAGMVINRLPYARKETEAKNRTVYARMTAKEYLFSIACALIPLCWLPKPVYLLAALLSVVAWYLLTTFMKRRIGGYTGDCCGALFLLSELSFYLGITVIHTILQKTAL